MAVRSDCSASSGLTSSAGGVRRPARCRAASTSTISERRESSEPRICCSRLSSGRSRASASPIRVSTPRTWAAMSISCWLSLLRSWPIAAISALSFSCNSAAFFCCARVASSSCSRCLMASGEGAVGLRRRSSRPAPRAGNRLMPARPADNKRDRKRNADRMRAGRGGRRQGGIECSALAASNSDRCLRGLRWRGLRAVIGMAGQNGRGPINLFQKHDANHLMRPGRGAEGQC